MMFRTLATMSLLAASAAVSAQPGPVEPWQWGFDAALSAQTNVDLDQGGGFSRQRWFLGGNLTRLWDPRTALGVSIGGGMSRYEFDAGSPLLSDAPWDDIEEFQLSVVGRWGFGERGSAIVVPSLRINREQDADDSDDQTWGLIAGAAWRLSSDLTIGPGFGVFSELVDDLQVFPIVLVDWKITERWTLATGRGLAASRGPGLDLAYRLNDAWSVGVAGRFEESQFRLDETGPAAGGVGEDRVFPVVATARWSPDPDITAAFFAGVGLGGELTLYDDRDREMVSDDYDPAPVLGASLRLRF